MGLKRVLSNPLTEDEAKSLTKDEKTWLRNWNRHGEIPGEEAPESEDDGSGGGDTDYEDQSVEELKDELRRRDLPISGNKTELIARLEEDDESEDDDDE